MTPSDIPPPFDAVWFRFVTGFIIGAVLGSFATMLAYRLPRHLSIITPRSHCPSCKTILEVRDLVPILSWLFNKGMCRNCHAKIGVRYLWIELTTSIACGVSSAVIGVNIMLVILYLVIVVGVVWIARLITQSPT